MKKWKTIIALLLMAFAIILDWNWFWAIFIFLGLIHVIQSGEIHFVESVTKNETPKLYWFMVVIWAVLALYSIADYLAVF
ncbi:hypothetical protein [Olleya sp. UBA1516]|uniref:hypothetical protein n=1 Tax=Olleya sp. UBA1516 TaxID=1947013 RepID=UPI0025DF2964|nr:hypothetical protein [Olleya sp. UBA1516]|tara:strand:- start:309 stop:548 length:240 start_codon:yes stop_codon:yes gene_type:complete